MKQSAYMLLQFDKIVSALLTFLVIDNLLWLFDNSSVVNKKAPDGAGAKLIRAKKDLNVLILLIYHSITPLGLIDRALLIRRT
jgi:hypothetical protein